MASFLTFDSFVFHCNLMQLVGGLIDPENVSAAGADTIPNKHGPNRFDDIWNMPLGKKLFLQLNKVGQSIMFVGLQCHNNLRIGVGKPFRY